MIIIKKQSDAIDHLWQVGWFDQYRKPLEIENKIEKDFGMFVANITPTLKLKRFRKKIKNFKGGWKQIRTAQDKTIRTESNIDELKACLGKDFSLEIAELEIVYTTCPNSTAFIMRKILEKLLFITISKSKEKQNITEIKINEKRLPSLSELIRFAKKAEINNLHILAPKNIEKIEGSKFLGDTSAHDYLTSVSFEDIRNEISFWRISIKQLCSSRASATQMDYEVHPLGISKK